MKYHCICCNYFTTRNNDFQKHLKTKKHLASQMYPKYQKQNVSKMYPKCIQNQKISQNHTFLSVNIVGNVINIQG